MPKTSPTTRLQWIDVVKGIAILLVVLYHSAEMSSGKSWHGDQMSTISDALLTVRMPLFFAMSGFFFHRRINRPWNWQLRNRTGPFLWLFLLWTALWVMAFMVIPWQRAQEYNWSDAARLFIEPGVGPWYIYALAIYFVAVKAMRKLPIWSQYLIGAAISLPVACGFIHVESWAWETLLAHFITFQIGVLSSATLATIAKKASVARLFAIGAAWAVGSGALYIVFNTLSNLGRIPLTVLGMALGITAASLIAKRLPKLRLDWFGRHTLPIYLLHVPFLGLVYSLDFNLPATTAVAVCAPITAVILAVTGSLAVWRVTRWIPGLFTAPWVGDGANTRDASPKNHVPTTDSAVDATVEKLPH